MRKKWTLQYWGNTDIGNDGRPIWNQEYRWRDVYTSDRLLSVWWYYRCNRSMIGKYQLLKKHPQFVCNLIDWWDSRC